MLMGIVAGAGNTSAAPSGGENLYPDALAYINFLTGAYWVGSTAYSAADVVNHPERVTTSGLYMGAGDVNLIGDMLAAWCVEEATVLADYNKADNIGTQSPFTILNDAGGGTGWQCYTQIGYFIANEFADTWGYSVLDDYDALGATTPSRVRMAATRIEGTLSLSAIGRAVVTASDASGVIAPNSALLSGFNGYVRELAIWTPRLDADLPDLSTIA